jgi:hypothetical protein
VRAAACRSAHAGRLRESTVAACLPQRLSGGCKNGAQPDLVVGVIFCIDFTDECVWVQS